MEKNKIYQGNCLELMKELGDCSVDIILTDPPYALGSEIIIRPDGKPDYSKATDFMNKWIQPDGKFWEEWFKEAYRILKYGGRLIMFAMDRQCMVGKYYSCLAGFTEQQSIYWYFISSFPKSADLSKNIDKRKGLIENPLIEIKNRLKELYIKSGKTITQIDKECGFNAGGYLRTIIRDDDGWGTSLPTVEKWKKIAEIINLNNEEVYEEFRLFFEKAEREIVGKGQAGFLEKNNSFEIYNEGYGNYDVTTPSTDLAKKYDGFKYSIAPLKQTCETIMIFQKEYKTGSCLHDTLAYENGDETCLCGALDIDGNRVPIGEEIIPRLNKAYIRKGDNNFGGGQDKRQGTITGEESSGRYPAQIYINSETAKVLDKQSGITTSPTGSFKSEDYETRETATNFKRGDFKGKGDTGGCSRILHKCDYDSKDFDLYIYEPKVDTAERNMCMEDSEDLEFESDVPVPQRADRPFNPVKNNHPTLKPISLMTKILKLFKTPNKQLILDPFAGSGSTLISAKHLGIDWIGFEIEEDYVRIAKARMSQSTLLGWSDDE